MNRQRGKNRLKKVENKAEELVALTFELCEERLASARAPLSHPQKALSAAAMTVQQSVETFLAVSQIPDQAGRRE
jgi:hypothetical protein